MSIKQILSMVMLIIAIAPGPVLAEGNILGFIKLVEGEVLVMGGQGEAPAKAGNPIYLGDRVKTAANGRLGLTFKDNTIISLGPDTEIVVDEYLFDPAETQLKLVVNMLKGTLHYISGVIAKLRPEAVSVKTPAGIIGVRGTRFLVKAEAE